MDSPKTEKTTEYFESHTGIKVGATGMQGWRIEMEDAHIATNMPTRPDHMFLAVFDGYSILFTHILIDNSSLFLILS